MQELSTPRSRKIYTAVFVSLLGLLHNWEDVFSNPCELRVVA